MKDSLQQLYDAAAAANTDQDAILQAYADSIIAQCADVAFKYAQNFLDYNPALRFKTTIEDSFT